MTINFSDKERKILGVLCFQADSPIPAIAAETGLTNRAVRYAVCAMAERQALQSSLAVDELRLGLQKYELLLSINPQPGVAIQEIEKDLCRSKIVWWISRVIGEYSHYLSLCVKNPAEVSAFFDRLTAKYGPIISKKKLALYRGWTYFGPKYLGEQSRFTRTLTTGFCEPDNSIDSLDLQLIAFISNNPLASNAELARHAGLPRTTVAFRAAKLRKSGVIGNSLYRVLPVSGITKCRVVIKSLYPSDNLRRRVHQLASASRNAVEIINVLGDWDYTIKLETENSDQLNSFITNFKAQLGSSIETISAYTESGDLKWRGEPSSCAITAKAA